MAFKRPAVRSRLAPPKIKGVTDKFRNPLFDFCKLFNFSGRGAKGKNMGVKVASDRNLLQTENVGAAKKRVLIVDDAATVRAMLRFSLEDAGYEVTEAADGQQALDLFARQQPIDLLILDLMMPRLDGLAVARAIRLRKSGQELPILMFTTEVQGEKIREGEKAEINGWIVKPFNPKQMVDVIRRFLP